MKIDILRGGSGKWTAFLGGHRFGQSLVTGHCPRNVTGNAFLEVCKRQFLRGLKGEFSFLGVGVQGGSMYQIEVSDDLKGKIEALAAEMKATGYKQYSRIL